MLIALDCVGEIITFLSSSRLFFRIYYLSKDCISYINNYYSNCSINVLFTITSSLKDMKKRNWVHNIRMKNIWMENKWFMAFPNLKGIEFENCKAVSDRMLKICNKIDNVVLRDCIEFQNFHNGFKAIEKRIKRFEIDCYSYGSNFIDLNVISNMENLEILRMTSVECPDKDRAYRKCFKSLKKIRSIYFKNMGFHLNLIYTYLKDIEKLEIINCEVEPLSSFSEDPEFYGFILLLNVNKTIKSLLIKESGYINPPSKFKRMILQRDIDYVYIKKRRMLPGQMECILNRSPIPKTPLVIPPRLNNETVADYVTYV